METVILKNGAEVAVVVATTTMRALEHLFTTEPILAYEVVMKARNPQHHFFGTTGQSLARLALVSESGHMHETIRAVIVSAVEGEGLNMKLSSPVKGAQ